jgi:hypothetical protein
MIKHLTPRTKQELTNMEKIWKRREVWRSPWVAFLLIGFFFYGIYLGFYWVFYAIIWAFKWIIFSWARPFSNSGFLCKQGFHKYRLFEKQDRWNNSKYYKCVICDKEIEIKPKYNIWNN